MSSTGIGVGASMIFGGVKASPSFEYSGSAFCADASDPTPTINGTPGGTFTAAPVAPNTGTLVINSSTGTVDLSASDVGNYLVTYTVGGKSESDPFEVLAVQSTAFSYSASSFQQTGTASPTITGNTGGVFTATTGLVIDANTGVIDLAASTIGGPYTVTYTNTGACQGTPSTFDVSVTAAYASTSSFTFDGINDYFGINPEVEFGPVSSISMWVKKATATGSGVILGGTNNNDYTLYLVNNRLFMWFASLNNIYTGPTSGTNTLTTTDWVHLAVVRTTVTELGDTVELYINGTSVFTNTNTLNKNELSVVNAIGRRNPFGANTANYFAGNIDEVSLWNTGLSSDAVTEIYNSGTPNDLTSLTNASSSNLKAWYKM